MIDGDAPNTPPTLPLAVLLQVVDICDSYEKTWRSGGRPAIERHLNGVAPSHQDELLLRLLELDVELRRRRGERPQLGEYVQRFPAHASTVYRAFQNAPTPPDDNVLGATIARNGAGGSAPDDIGDYQLLTAIGQGGMGVVYKAIQRGAGRTVALKLIRPELLTSLPGSARDEAIARFLTEGRAAAAMTHDHIVTVYDVGESDGRHYFAMRFVDGSSLAAVLRDGPLDGHRAAAILEPVANAIHYAHTRGVLHRDIKPSNILLDCTGRPFVTDFGLAKQLEKLQAGDVSRAGLGTASYMSPEQALGQDRHGIPSDVYGLGATLYEMLTGHPPFRAADPVETLRQVVEIEPVPPRRLNPSIPRDLQVICLKSLEKDPRNRYPTAADLAHDLARWSSGLPIKARQLTFPARSWRWARRKPAFAGLVAALCLAALAVAFGIMQAVRASVVHQARIRDLMNSLLTAPPDAVLPLIDRLSPYRDEVEPILNGLLQSSDLDRYPRVRVCLALLPWDSSQADHLCGDLLEADPRELKLLRDALYPHRVRLISKLWEQVGSESTPDRRLRAASALAAFDPGSSRWSAAAGDVSARLVATPEDWAPLLRPVRDAFLPPLRTLVSQRDASEQADRTAIALAELFSDRPDILIDLVTVANPKQTHILASRIRLSDRVRAVDRLDRLVGQWRRGPPESGNEPLVSAAVAFLLVGRPDHAWPIICSSDVPDVCSAVVHAMREGGVPPEVLVTGLAQENPPLRRALIQALGEFPPAEVPAATRGAAIAYLIKAWQNDLDAGIHSSAEWTLRRWGMDSRLPTAGLALDMPPVDARRGWVTGPEGHTFTLLRGPVTFVMGSPSRNGSTLDAHEKPTTITIPRTVAMATKEVTISQYRRFNSGDFEKTPAHDPACPVDGVSLYEAMRYCRWLSELAGISESQMCYPPIPQIAAGMKLPSDYLARTGFRLPTEAEWEFACRAGTKTNRFFGDSARLLGQYGRHIGNSDGHLWPVGGLKPNDLGLFDVYGNVAEWTGDLYQFDGVIADPGQSSRSRGQPIYVLRGGAFLHSPPALRSARRIPAAASAQLPGYGFRVARTLPSTDGK